MTDYEIPFNNLELKLEVTPAMLEDDSEIKRLSALAETIHPISRLSMPFEPGDNAGYRLGFPYSRGVTPS